MPQKIKVICIFLLSLASIAGSSALDTAEEFAGKFQRTTAIADRLQLSVDAINHKVIRNGLSASGLKSFFGADYVEDDVDPGPSKVT